MRRAAHSPDTERGPIRTAAIHADVIVGFPTEDDGAWRRSLAFIGSLDLAGLHVFRYSARPGTAATRMAGQVDEATKKERAGELIALAAEARAVWAARHVGGMADVLFERRLADGRWLGHAADHVLVAAPASGSVASLGNAIGRVAIDAVDPAARDRIGGRILGVSPPPGVPTVAR